MNMALYYVRLYLEFVNSVTTILALGALAAFLSYLYSVRHREYYEHRPFIGITIFMFGESIVQASLWYDRHIMNNGGTTDPITFLLSNAIGRFFVFVGFACIIRVYFPERFGHQAWIVCMLASFVVATTSVAISYF